MCFDHLTTRREESRHIDHPARRGTVCGFVSSCRFWRSALKATCWQTTPVHIIHCSLPSTIHLVSHIDNMFGLLPPTIHRLIVLFLLATPLLAIASPVADPAPSPLEAPTKLQPRKPAPSRRMGQRRAKKAEPLKKKDYSSFLCPGGSVACPIPPHSLEGVTPQSAATLGDGLNSLADWFKVGFECIELDTELNSCGGCLALGAGYVCWSALFLQSLMLDRQDCATISNARATGCQSGTCVVYSCFDGYVVGPDRQTCIKKGTATPAIPITAVNVYGQTVFEEGA